VETLQVAADFNTQNRCILLFYYNKTRSVNTKSVFEVINVL